MKTGTFVCCWEYKGGFFNTKGVSIPVAVSVFPGEQYQAPRGAVRRLDDKARCRRVRPTGQLLKHYYWYCHS